MYFDAVAVDDRNMLRLLLFSVFGDPRHVRWLDGNDPPTPDTPTAGDTALTPAIKEVFAAMFNRGNKTDA